MRFLLALLFVALPSLASAQTYPSPTFASVKIGGANGQTITGVGTAPGTVAAGNDSRIVGAVQAGSAASLASLALATPLPLSQGGCGALSALGCLTNLGLAGGTSGNVLTSNGPGTVPTYQPAAAGSGSAVLYTSQSLSLPQQLQARQNIGVRGAGILAKSAAYTVATTDAGKLIAASGTWALTLPSAATAGNGFAFELSNTGTGKITLTPNGTDTIGGAASLVVNQKESGTLISDGTNWQVIGFAPVIVATLNNAAGSYVRYSNGYTVQWGTVTGNGTDQGINFPLAYTSTPAVVVSGIAANSSTTIIEAVNAASVATTGFIGRYRFISGAGGTPAPGTANYNWRAEGFI